MNSTKALLVLHGKQATNEELREAVRQWRDLGHELAVRVTWEPGDTARLVQEALAAGYRRLVAGGGDGTVREMTEALLGSGSDASLAVLPLGTANDFAHAAQIPVEIRNLSEAEARAADEVWVTSSSKEVLAIVKLDGNAVGDGRPGPVFRRMHQLYQEFKTTVMRAGRERAAA